MWNEPEMFIYQLDSVFSKKESYWDQVDGAATWEPLTFEPRIVAIPENHRV